MSTGPAPWRKLLALAVAVLAAHLLLLRATPGSVPAADRLAHRILVTRTLVVPPAAMAEPPPAPASVLVAAAPAPHRAAARVAAPVFQAKVSTIAATLAAAPAPSAPTTAPTLAFHIPASVRLHYKVMAQSRGLNWQADGELQWRHDGQSYEARLAVRAPLLPTRTQQSTGSITPQGLAPLRFSDKGRTEEAAHFQRDQGKVTFSSNRPDSALLAGGQDRLSVLLQLGAMIAGAPAKFPPATSIAIQTAGTRDAEPWHFTVEGEETLQLPGGTLSALKLTRNPRKEFDQRVELWLAPGMDYVPVRLRLTQPNGDWVDQQWSSTDRG
jgi:hypothetical protein